MKAVAGFALVLLLTATAFGGPITFIALNDPNATGGTYASGINNAGQITGYFVDAAGDHGFYYDGKTYTTLDDPNAIAALGGTRSFGINDSGQIVGTYFGSGIETQHGFIYDGSTYTTLDHPSFGSIAARGINNGGEIVGVYDDAIGSQLGFSYAGSTWTTIDDPDAGLYEGIIRSFALGVSDSGLIAGFYLDGSGFEHGYIYDGSTFTKLDDPNASALFGGTVAFGVNSLGHVVGDYFDSTGEHAFFFDGSTYTTLGPNAIAVGVNDLDQVVGFYQPPPPVPSSVPEPGSAELLVLGGAFVWSSRLLARKSR